MKRFGALLVGMLLTLSASACGPEDTRQTVRVEIGYQSRTLNTVTAGTLLRGLGYFERNLAKIGEVKNIRYEIAWNDFASGAPITAKMIASQIDIGSMGDFPLLINAYRTAVRSDTRTELIAATAYSESGALNGIVAPADSTTSPGHLDSLNISTSIGSAAHGLLLRAEERGLIQSDSEVINQTPAVGAAGIRSKQVDALAQFAPWPGLLAFRGYGRLVLDGARVGAPTFHGVVARTSFAQKHPEVVKAFVASVEAATNYLRAHHLEASKKVADSTKLPLDVVYLYLGPFGLATFSTSLSPLLVDSLEQDQVYLRKVIPQLDVDVPKFVNSGILRSVVAASEKPSPTRSCLHFSEGAEKEACLKKTFDTGAPPAEILFRDGRVVSYATPSCLVQDLDASDAWDTVSSIFITDPLTGTRWFGADATWVRDAERAPSDALLAFATRDVAQNYRDRHPSARLVSFSELEATP